MSKILNFQKLEHSFFVKNYNFRNFKDFDEPAKCLNGDKNSSTLCQQFHSKENYNCQEF